MAADSNAVSTDMSVQGKGAKPRYSVTDLGPIGLYVDVNDKGAFLKNGATSPNVTRNGVTRQIPAACMQQGYAINDKGSVAGAGSSRPVLYIRGTCHDLGTLGGSFGYARDVNKHEDATGAANLAGDASAHAFLYADGVTRDLGTLGGTTSAGYAISDNDLVTGSSTNAAGQSHAFLYQRGRMKDLGTLGGYSQGFAVNNDGQVVGESALPCTRVPPACPSVTVHAFLYEKGVLKDIDPLTGFYSTALSINSNGDAVGYRTDNDEFEDFRGFVYTDGKLQVLNDILDRSGTVWILLEANKITDDGEIYAFGFLNGDRQTIHAALLTPSRAWAVR